MTQTLTRLKKLVPKTSDTTTFSKKTYEYDLEQCFHVLLDYLIELVTGLMYANLLSYNLTNDLGSTSVFLRHSG